MGPEQSPGAISEKGTSDGVVGNGDAEPTGTEQRQDSEQDSGDELQFQDQSSRMSLKKILAVYLGIGEDYDPEFRSAPPTIYTG